jgi:hypothetical protein
MSISRVSPLIISGGFQLNTCNCRFCQAKQINLGEQTFNKAQSLQLQALKTQDKKTRAHELAHLQTAGLYATGFPVYHWEEGPDGQEYANGGHVEVDVTPIQGDPQATLEKMRTIQKAALAPEDPSPQDYAVFAKAQALMEKAHAQLARKQALSSPFSVLA